MPEVIREKGDIQDLDVFYKALEQLDHLECKIGWFESARYPDEDATPVAMVAAQNEFGNENLNIPPRPFMRPAIAEHSSQWNEALESGSKDIIKGHHTAKTVMESLGALVAGQIREKIAEVQSPVLSDVTIIGRVRALNKKFSGIGQIDKYRETGHTITKPLVFTGILKNTLTYVVDEGEEVMPYESEAVDRHNVYGKKP